MVTPMNTLSRAPSADGIWHNLHLIDDGGTANALAIHNGEIAWMGEIDALPAPFNPLPRIDARGALATPGLIDCHTHLVYGGQRANEFAMRLAGASYEEVAKAGGGIVSSVKATRAASEDELYALAAPRLQQLLADGVCAIEIKSGYGLSLAHEAKQLRVARRLGRDHGVTVRTSFLGAHALPPEYAGRSQEYINLVCDEMLPALHAEGLVDAVDGFCEGIAFTPGQIERVFIKARELGLPVKLHAEQLSNLGGATLAARYGAQSADHLEYLDEDGIKAMAAAGTVAGIVPGAFYTLRETKVPPIALLRKHGVPMAVATDCNPGSSPMTSLLLSMNMACTLFRLTCEEALAGTTRNAACALGLDDCGTVEPGKRADLCVWNVAHPAELSYRIGFNPLHQRLFASAP